MIPLLLANWRIVLLGLLLAAIGVQTWRLDRCQSQYEEFRISTEALGRAQAAKNKAIQEANEKLNQEVVDAKNKAISDLSTRYADARRRLRDNARSGGVSPAPEAPALSSACQPANQPSGRLDGDQEKVSARLAEVEAALLDALERADREMVKYRQLWTWTQQVQ